MDLPLSAVRAAARAGVRRRRLQTVSIAVVVALSTATLVFGLGLLAASNSLFDDAFDRARGAHATVAFDPAKVTAAQAAATAHATGVTAAAGPFLTAVLPREAGSPGMQGQGEGSAVVGRADAGGPVDRLTVTSGRWLRGPGEIVLRGEPIGPMTLGGTISPQGLPPLTIVGFAASATGKADGWVTPAQIGALRPSGLQMLYRFDRAADSGQVRQGLSAATAGLPVLGSDSYVTARHAFEQEFNGLIPFVAVFGALALAVSVFIIGNVVSGAVVAGFRHIGVMKAIGFTPVQVTAVYVVMVVTPALLGCAVGVLAGELLAARAAKGLASGFELPSVGGTDPVPGVLAGGCVIVLVALAALVPALRAGRLPAVRAISAGAATARGRGRGRRSSGWARAGSDRVRLPVPVGLGLSVPFARPARTALTLAGLCLAVTAVTIGVGLQHTVTKMLTADTEGHTSVSVHEDPRREGPANLTEQQVYALLRAQPGTAHAMSFAPHPARTPAIPSGLTVEAYSGDYGPFLGDNIVRGRWFTGPGEVVPAEALLRLHHLDVGDTLSLEVGGEKVEVRIVGSFAHSDTDRLMLDGASLPNSGGGIEKRPFSVIVKPGTDPAAYADRFNAASSGLFAEVTEPDLGGAAALGGLFLLFTLIICTTAALGVLNSVVLSTRERSRDLGVLKAVGMTPRQVVLMTLTSMAVLGIAGGAIGVPVGVLAHHGVAVLTGDMIGSGMAASWIHVFSVPLLVPLACSGLVIAVLGAWPPAGRAAAIRTATVLRSE